MEYKMDEKEKIIFLSEMKIKDLIREHIKILSVEERIIFKKTMVVFLNEA
jgi:hypothetical protein